MYIRNVCKNAIEFYNSKDIDGIFLKISFSMTIFISRDIMYYIVCQIKSCVIIFKIISVFKLTKK